MWKDKLILAEGEELRFDGRVEKGHLGQEEVMRYSVMREGEVVGTVQYTEHTNIKAPYRQSMHLVQKRGDATVVETSWE